MNKLPWLCPRHPDAQIRHEWNRIRATVRATGASYEYNEKDSHRYFCATCGTELRAEEKP